MLSSLLDQKNAVMKNLMGDSKVDPGTFSFLESGWWALHAAAITGAIILGSRISKRY